MAQDQTRLYGVCVFAFQLMKDKETNTSVWVLTPLLKYVWVY